MFSVLEITLLAFVLNIPFGYFRTRSKKYSLKWWLCVHTPVPIVIFARLALEVDYKFIPVFIAASIVGQFIGGKITFNV
ncbi:MAG: hypothetical protein EPN22_11465 [Nitrospirae bacterium]|nr:MAG: hypothetical protein EPN22_11465 [Nitrospirota bacterium]